MIRYTYTRVNLVDRDQLTIIFAIFSRSLKRTLYLICVVHRLAYRILATVLSKSIPSESSIPDPLWCACALLFRLGLPREVLGLPTERTAIGPL